MDTRPGNVRIPGSPVEAADDGARERLGRLARTRDRLARTRDRLCTPIYRQPRRPFEG